MATGSELKDIAKKRLDASEILLKEKDYDGCVYLMGYVLECALKSVICKTLNLKEYPEKDGSGPLVNVFRTHILQDLLRLSGLEADLQLTSGRRYENWSELTKWNTNVRYQPIGTWDEKQAVRMLNALVEKPDGLITFIECEKKW
jgi:hypothetical protein